MKENILEIALDNGVKHTRYWTLNYHVGCDAKMFESSDGIKPLAIAKKWAKGMGYTQLVVISLTLKKKDKTYIL